LSPCVWSPTELMKTKRLQFWRRLCPNRSPGQYRAGQRCPPSHGEQRGVPRHHIAGSDIQTAVRTHAPRERLHALLAERLASKVKLTPNFVRYIIINILIPKFGVCKYVKSIYRFVCAAQHDHLATTDQSYIQTI